MTSVRRALAFSMAERYALIALSLAGNILVARLLTPEEIGLFSVALALIGIAQVLRDFGVGNFLIQERELNDEHIRTAFGFSLVIGAALFVLVFAAAPLAGGFYRDARIVDTIRIGALNFLVLPFCSISVALLRRELQFKRLAAVNLVAALVGFAVTITLALRGFGANGLAIGALAGNLATGAGAWLARSERRVLLPSFGEWRKLLHFGARSSAANVVTSISMDINDLAIGRILGFGPVAMISRAQGLMNLFHRDVMSAVRNVAYPAFARAFRENDDLEARHAHAVAAVTVLAWPFYAFAALHALELLRLLFGPQWDAAAPLVPWFCLAGAAGATCSLVIPLLTARGRIDLATRIDLVIQPIRAVVLVGGVIAFQNMLSFAILFAAFFVLSVPYIYRVKARGQANDLPALFGGLKKSLLVTAACMLPPLLVLLAPQGGGIARLLLSATLCALAWVAAVALFRHPLADEPLFRRALRMLRPGWN
ncbi:lipopolysaccharide biosynthesis protein [Pseudothauera nasutitermitis]|uniref:Lipopolysaccharide biosynthesis protein n=1 Tax=Pseudothauera nasutitermitis TaxID=2565930 RepID=A0A4S4AUN4_9RHOO|nr:lipopolysaccharide biosynthesis protein [Pseudothauera nasutitermitis]THF63646.1 lipopolysaccharide biosynthesis protein [Pseudothauera nasutitermitis]